MAITLSPPSDPDSPSATDVLTDGITAALAADGILLLEPGTYPTKPGHLNVIEVDANGLTIASTGASPLPLNVRAHTSRIKRPGHSIASDFSYGLFFKPAKHTDTELVGVTWKPATDADGHPFEYTVLMRGNIHLSGLLVDCNMQNQGLETLDDVHTREHCAMLGFSGTRHKAANGPGEVPRWVYVGFESVTLQDIGLINGGYADDIWVKYDPVFHPHIERFIIERIESGERVDPHRDTISFSGLAHRISIHDAKVESLHAEQDGDWKDAPRRDATFSNAVWDLADIATEKMVFSIKGKVMSLAARRLAVRSNFQVNFAGGLIADSTLRVAVGQDARFFRLDGMHFHRVIWQLPADANGVVGGIRPTCRFNDTCVATFTDNIFTAIGSVSAGQLIDSEYSTQETDNRVTLTFSGCSYHATFGTAALPQTRIARVRERGAWTFRAADLGGRDPTVALPKGPQSDVVRDLT